MSLSSRLLLVALLAAPAPLAAQSAPVTGEAILRHPLGVLATKSVDAIAAGRMDEYASLRIKSDQDEWKAMSAADKRDYGARLKERVPSPAVVADLVRQGGELTISADSATLVATTMAGMLREVFIREGGQWRVSFGPMFMAAPPSTPTVEVKGDALSRHPAIAVVLQYNDLVQAGQTAAALTRFGTAQALSDFNALPAQEKARDASFRKSLLPGRLELTRAIAAGGTLTVEDNHATLIVITGTPATASNSRGSSTSLTVPLMLENGTWKIAQ